MDSPPHIQCSVCGQSFEFSMRGAPGEQREMVVCPRCGLSVDLQKSRAVAEAFAKSVLTYLSIASTYAWLVDLLEAWGSGSGHRRGRESTPHRDRTPRRHPFLPPLPGRPPRHR